MEEKELVTKCIKQNRKAQWELYKRFAPQMKGVCLRYSSNEPDAEDVLQEGFVRVFSCLDSFKSTGPLGGWIRRIMVNTALELYRKNKNLRVTQSFEDIYFESETSEDVLAKIAADELLGYIQNLPKRYQMVFNLYAIEGYNHREIGELMEISEGTSKSQYSRARKILEKEVVKNIVYGKQSGNHG